MFKKKIEDIHDIVYRHIMAHPILFTLMMYLGIVVVMGVTYVASTGIGYVVFNKFGVSETDSYEILKCYDGNYYMGCTIFGMLIIMVCGLLMIGIPSCLMLLCKTPKKDEIKYSSFV